MKDETKIINSRMLSKKSDISIIIINYNSSLYTINCLKSIEKEVKNDLLTYQIIIIDNNSEIEDYNKLKLFCDNIISVTLTRSKINLGFSGANMLGYQLANSDYLFFLNNDTELLNDNLKILYDFMKSKPDAGIVTGQMYNSDRTFHHSFGYFPTLRLHILGTALLRLFNPDKYLKKNIQYSEPFKVDLVTGAAMFIDYHKFVETGGFDTTYFLYCEEEDIAMRLRKNNYLAYVVPSAKFIHHSGKSTNRSLEIEKENYISLMYYHKKFNGIITYTFLKLFYFLKNLRKFYKNSNYLKLAIFILFNAKMKNSLKFKQKVRLDDEI